MIERMQMVLKGDISAEDRAQFWVGLTLAVATILLLAASFLDLVSI